MMANIVAMFHSALHMDDGYVNHIAIVQDVDGYHNHFLYDLFLDEEQEELESKYGCPMVELDEDELLEIVEQFVKLTPESAKWEENMQGIKYKYQEECA